MKNRNASRLLIMICCALFSGTFLFAQNKLKTKYNNSSIQAGIEVGSKGVKLSILEIGKNAKTSGAFNILKDTSVNTDFISFSQPTFQATLNGLYGLYITATKEYKIPSDRVFTVVSSGVKVQAEKESKSLFVSRLIDSFKLKINDDQRKVEVVDVIQEAKLSHLGIVPESKRYTTFLIDIGSGNTKGGYFPNGNTDYFKLFQLSWGTKSVANATEKKCEDDKSLANFNRQLTRVLQTAENTDIIYAVNESGSYPASDIIAFSGGIAWSVATLLHPELIDNSIVPVTFDEVTKFSQKLYTDTILYTDKWIIKNLMDKTLDNDAIANEVKRVHFVFDQRSLMSGTGLLLKIMRQFEGIYEKKQFFLVKNGQVGWISAYVDQNTVR